MRKFLVALLVVAVTALTSVGVWYILPNKTACQTSWIGETDRSFMEKVKQDLKAAKQEHCKMLKIDLLSPGGSVIFMMEIVKDIRRAEKDGLIVEIHASSLNASAATFILASGSKGHRFISKHTITLVHPPSRGYEAGCINWIKEPLSVDSKIDNQVLNEMAQLYSELTGHPLKETRLWITCGKEYVGGADVLVKLGIADKVTED